MQLHGEYLLLAGLCLLAAAAAACLFVRLADMLGSVD
jgi:hypothetical protein